MTTPEQEIVTDKMWHKNFNILFRADRATEFFPNKDQSFEERLNSIARLGLYISILVTVYKRDVTKMTIFIAFLLATYFLFKNYNKEEFVEKEGKKVKKEMEKKQRKPTLNNPFMNRLPTDDKNLGPAPEYFEDTKTAKDIRDEVNTKFTHDLYMGIDDIYEKNNAQRQFYTTPNTENPSNQEKFLKFMYPNMTSCKSDSKDCKITEDLRGRPFIFPDQTQNPTTEKLL